MNIDQEAQKLSAQLTTRRHFLKNCSLGLGSLAMGSFMGCNTWSGSSSEQKVAETVMQGIKQYAPTAKRVIFLHMAGGPSQLELFDYKPELEKLDGKPCPDSILEGKKFAFISGTPSMLGPQAKFRQHGQSGAWVSERLPHLSQVVDDLCFLKAMHTDQFNHAPAQLLLYSGSPRLGRPSMGSWVTYGLGSENQNLPGFVVLVSGGNTPSAGKSVWGSGFLPSVYQGVQCRSHGDPVLYVSDPPGMSRELRGKSVAAINKINEEQYQEFQDPEILTRIAQYEMAFKMQMSVPEAMNIDQEPDYIHQMYGTEPGKTSFANNCLLARRLAERDVRFIQLFHWGWDNHGAGEGDGVTDGLVDRCHEVDRPMAALIRDLKQRGLLDDTVVVWGGEFGRTPMQENREGVAVPYIGRDHHTDAYTMWMAGGGIKGGITHGETDAIGFHGIRDRVHVHDLQATILHTLGIDHEKLTYRFQSRDFRLTDVGGRVIKPVLA
jgi:hypothetical protein